MGNKNWTTTNVGTKKALPCKKRNFHGKLEKGFELSQICYGNVCSLLRLPYVKFELFQGNRLLRTEYDDKS